MMYAALVSGLLGTSASWPAAAQGGGDSFLHTKGYNADLLGNLAYRKAVNVSNYWSDGNIAYGKPAAASNVYGGSSSYDGSKAVDGDPTTRWATDDGGVVTAATLEIDLGAELTFNKFEFTQFAQRIGSYKIQYWNGTQWNDAYTGGKANAGYTDPANASSSTPESAIFTPVTGSKVRLYITSVIGISGPSVWEFKVFNTNDHSDIYRNKQFEGSKAVDANPGSYWAAEDNTNEATLDVDFGADMTFDKVEFMQPDQRIGSYKIQYWNGSKWLDAFSGGQAAKRESVTFAPVTGSKVRLNITSTINGPDGPRISEFEAFNTNAHKGISRGDKVLIDKGLQLQAWVTTEQTGRYYPSASEWQGIHFTTPMYYEEPLYNQAMPNSQWAIAKAPYADQLKSGPTSDGHFLSEEQRANVSNLVNMQFGDEEGFGTQLVGWLRDWYDLSRKLYPNVLVHNNQWAFQWSEDQLRSYVRAAKPDLLTFDAYYFDMEPNRIVGGSVLELYNSLSHVRSVAQEGYDGTGNSPIPFGQYTLGYKTGNNPASVGPYVVSESQINIVSFATWAMGGKWTNLFRYEQDPSTFLFYDDKGNLTPQYDQYARLAKQGRNLGPYLVRLNSTGVQFIPGEHREGGQVVTNKTPSDIPVWSASDGSPIKNIQVENTGTTNNGLKGDVLIGQFEPLNGVNDGFLPAKATNYFMILNGLTDGNGKLAPEQRGTSDETTQKITLMLDTKGKNPNALKRVSRETGEIESVPLTHITGTKYKLVITLGGGMADLFFWDQSPSK